MTEPVVDRPLTDDVLEAIDADTDLADAAKYLVMAALEGDDALAGSSTGRPYRNREHRRTSRQRSRWGPS